MLLKARTRKDSVRVIISAKKKKEKKNNQTGTGSGSVLNKHSRQKVFRKLKIKKIMIFFLIIMLVQRILAQEDDLTVTVEQGKLFGMEKINRLNEKPYYAFVGIPYARPPIGVYRFKDPEDPLPWSDVFNATQEGSSCMSYSILFKYVEGSEDCLNLHIFTPKKPVDLQDSLRPVMVWIHGGAFVSGSGRPSEYGPDFFMLQDIVLVNINYRLNIFGFLSLQNDAVPGNAGLKDQVKALKWIQTNIKAFGGDPNKVTIFGESAGGASVHYLMLSPSAKGLFHRVIAQSGVAINPWASTKNILETAYKIGKMFDCDTRTDEDLLECLQKVNAHDLASRQYNVISLKTNEFLNKGLNLPCTEPKDVNHTFLTENPRKVLDEGKFNDVPLLLGAVRVETLILERLFTDDVPASIQRLVLTELNRKPFLLLPQNLVLDDPQKLVRSGQKLKEFYFQDKPISNETIDNLINVTSDAWFVLGIRDAALLHSQLGKSPVYLYQFTLNTEFKGLEMLKTLRPGPAHADDLKYFWYMTKKDLNIKPHEMELVSKINKLWINFAKFGNPTPNDDNPDVVWEPFNPEKQSYLEIGETFTLKAKLEEYRMAFWKHLILEENLAYY